MPWGNVCPCNNEELRSPSSAMQSIGQYQLPRETISRAKDCNGGLNVRYFEVLVDALPATR